MSATVEPLPLHPTLAQVQLPRRVRRALEQVYALAADEMARALERMLAEFEQQLFRQADQAINPSQQQSCFDTLRMVRQNRADLIPQFLSGLEAALAGIRAGTDAPQEPSSHLHFGELRLVEDQELDEGSVLRAISSRHEARASLPLHLLGQRFGVLACAPAYDAQHLPVGPHRLCAIMAVASHVLQIDPQPRLDLFRCFDQYALHGYTQLVDAMNATLVRESILPNLVYVPIRVRPALHSELTGEAGRERRELAHERTPAEAAQPYTGWFGVDSGGDGPQELSECTPQDPEDLRTARQPQLPASSTGAVGGQAGPSGRAGQAGRLVQAGQAGQAGQTGPAARVVQGGHAGPVGQEAGQGSQAGLGSQAGQGNVGNVPGRAGGGDPRRDFPQLQQMLAARRTLPSRSTPDGKAHADGHGQLSTEDVMHVLARMQDAAAMAPLYGNSHLPRTVHEVRQALLAQTRQLRGESAALSRDDNDVFELLGLLLVEIQRQLRQDAPSNRLLHRLIVPLLRLVLKDHDFFVERTHPARQLLNAVAESGAAWVPEEESDPQLNDQLRHAVDEVVTRFRGDPGVFEEANLRVQQHLHAMARRAEVAERRYIDAARGRERLELARRRAGEVIGEASHGHRLPHFVQALLANSWADVLTLTLLRHDEDSEEWQQQLAATRAIAQATALDQLSMDPPSMDPPSMVRPSPATPGLAARIARSLALVGYHADEAAGIARHLTASGGESDTTSRTELAMKLKARERLGQDTPPATPEQPPRNEQEQDAYQVLRTLPFGTWFEFRINQQGDVVRRRLSWYSRLTDRALFVNQRGQRVAEQSLDSLARAIAQDQVRVVTVEYSSLVERAWRSTLNALRGFIGGAQASGESLA